jgi:hypothetical protein
VRAPEETYHGNALISAPCDTTPIDRNMEFGRHLFIDSTPTFVLQNGKITEGYASPNIVEDLLKLNSSL